MKGTIKKLTDKHFGFISMEDNQNDLFFHSNNLDGIDFDDLREGDSVEFEIIDTPRGQAADQIKKA